MIYWLLNETKFNNGKGVFMKKVFLVIALVAIGLTVVPQVFSQDMAKLQALQSELEQIEARATARGSFTPQEVQRMNEIQQEIIQAMGPMSGLAVPAQPSQQGQQALQQAQQREQQQQQQREQNARADYIKEHNGTNRNWPAASVLNRYQIPLRQPSGTTASHTVDRSVLYIYLQNANETAFQNIKQQIETATNTRMESFGRYGWIARKSTGQNTGFVYTIELQYDVITIEMNTYDNSKG
jgi:hypothetical protein